MSFWDTLLTVGGDIAGAVYLGDPNAGGQADALIQGATGGPIGGGGGGGGNPLGQIGAGMYSNILSKQYQDQVQKSRDDALNRNNQAVGGAQADLMQWYNSIANPALSGRYQPMTLGNAPQMPIPQIGGLANAYNQVTPGLQYQQPQNMNPNRSGGMQGGGAPPTLTGNVPPQFLQPPQYGASGTPAGGQGFFGANAPPQPPPQPQPAPPIGQGPYGNPFHPPPQPPMPGGPPLPPQPGTMRVPQ